MRNMTMRKWTTALMLCLLFTGILSRRAQAQFFLITIETTILRNQNGNIDVQFNPGGADALAANALVTNSQTDGAFGLASVNIGGSSGTLGGGATISIDNSEALNDHFQAMTFGNSIEMVVCFSGPALTPGLPLPISGSTFAVSLFDPAGVNPLLTTSPDGSLLHIEVNPDGSLEPITFPDAAGTVHSTIVPLASCVPEPGEAGLLCATAGIGLAWTARRRQGERQSENAGVRARKR